MDDQTLGDYFASLKVPFERTLADLEARHTVLSVGRTTAVLCLILSVIPAIPRGLALLIPAATHAHSVTIYGHLIPLNSLWLWWPLAVIVSGLCVWFLAGTSARRARDRKKRSLPTPQMRFALCYALAQEVRNYQINHLPEHVDRALDYCDRLAGMLHRMLGQPISEPAPERVSPHPEVVKTQRSVEIAGIYLLESPFMLLWSLKQRFDWFRIDPKSEEILRAIALFHEQIRDRIKDRKDFDAIEKALVALAAYLYSIVPEVSPSAPEGETSAVHDSGAQGLDNFAASMNALPRYLSEAKIEAKEGSLAKWLYATLRRCGNLFSHQSMLVCFLSWYFLSLVLILMGFQIARYEIADLKPDSVIVATAIGTPLVAAVTAVVSISQRRKQQDAD